MQFLLLCCSFNLVALDRCFFFYFIFLNIRFFIHISWLCCVLWLCIYKERVHGLVIWKWKSVILSDVSCFHRIFRYASFLESSECVYLAANVRMLRQPAERVPSVTNMLKLLKQGAEKSCQPIRISVNARAWRTFEWNTRRCEQYKSATRASKNANEQAFSQITSSSPQLNK